MTAPERPHTRTHRRDSERPYDAATAQRENEQNGAEPGSLTSERYGEPPAHAREARLLIADELAERWQVPKAQVYRLAREGKVPAVRVGRYFRFNLAAIEAWELAGGVRADG